MGLGLAILDSQVPTAQGRYKSRAVAGKRATCQEVMKLLNRDIWQNRRDASTPKASQKDVKTVIPTVLERGGA